MDKRIANNLMVGSIVIVGFFGFIFLLFNMGGGKGIFSRSYTLYGKFSHVKGLHMGSEVALAGLRVGVVNHLTITNDGKKELDVELAIEKQYQDKIRQDSIATIRTQGVLGDKYIEISIGSMDFKTLQDGESITTAEDPDIITKSGNLVSGISKQFQPGGDLETLMKNLNVVAANLAHITTSVRHDKSILHELIYGNSGVKVNNATSHVEEIMRKKNRGEGTLGALINDPTVYEDIKALMGGAKRSAILQYFMRQFVDSGRKQDSDSKPKK